MRLPAVGNLWRTQRYKPWRVKRKGSLLESLEVVLPENSTYIRFSYDGLGVSDRCTPLVEGWRPRTMRELL